MMESRSTSGSAMTEEVGGRGREGRGEGLEGREGRRRKQESVALLEGEWRWCAEESTGISAMLEGEGIENFFRT